MATDGDWSEIIAQQEALLAFVTNPQSVLQKWIDEKWKLEAKRIAPVFTGAFRDSLDGKAGPGGAVVFAGVDYGADVEFGNSHRRAQPTLMPAILSTISFIGVFFDQEIQRIIR